MQRKLGTFLGVFTPTILTILGVIMYLRTGWLVGHLGLVNVLLIVIVANTITLITALSFSSVATNASVGAGGAYYIISRSLGIEIGGAIGLPLFLSQTFSVTLYAFGLAESLRFVWPDISVQLATFAIVASVGILAIFGAPVALKAQIPLLVLVAVSLVALGIGAVFFGKGNPKTVLEVTSHITFWQGFAIFFPAVTGVMAGLGLSGDLKDPMRSIPLGALAATVTGFVIYLVVPVILAMGAGAEQLRNEDLVWTRIAPLGPWLILPGLWSAILSSAIGSILAAPRTLQAMARDGLVFRFLGPASGTWKDIVPGLSIAIAISLGAVFIGNLNDVAAVVSMFFLTVYGIVNLVAAFEFLSGDPSWRPRIRVAWPINFAGGLACVVTMFLISPEAGCAAIVAEICLYLVLSRRERQVQWGDARRGLYEKIIRWALIQLARRRLSARNWRPHILTFISNPLKDLDLVRFSGWFSQNRSIVTVCQLVIGDLAKGLPDIHRMEQSMHQILQAEGLVVFSEVYVVSELVQGIVNVSQANGMASIASNTVVVGWPSDPVRQVDFIKVLPQLERLGKSMIIGRIRPQHLYPREAVPRTIHVWWSGLQRNGDLLLLLAYLLTRNPSWRNAKVKVMGVASNEMSEQQIRANLNLLIPKIRIRAEAEVTAKPKDMTIAEFIQRQSASAEVVFMGLATPEEGKEAAYAERLEHLAGDLPTVFFVKNATLFIGDLLESEAVDISGEAV